MKRRYLLPCALLAMATAMEAMAATAPSLAVDKTIPGPDGGWDFVSVDATSDRLYVAHGDAVLSLDLSSGKVTPRLASGNHVHAVLPLGDGRVLSTNGASDNAVIFDGMTGKVLATIPTGPDPDAAILDPSSGLVVVMQGHAGNIVLIDPQRESPAGTISIGGNLEYAVADGRGRVLVNIENKGEIAVVDVARRAVLTHYRLPDCDEPSGLALDRSTGVMLAACANGMSVALKASDGTVIGTVPIGRHPDAVIFDSKRNLFFVPCGDGSLVGISADAGGARKIVTVPTAPGARTGALDEKTGRIYLPTADITAPPPGKRHPDFTPGTFRILVVGDKQ